MKKRMKIAALICATAVAATALVGCSGEKKPVLKVANWGDFIAEGVISDFEEEYNCKVIYSEYDSNEIMLAQVRNSGADNYDVVFPSDYAVAAMREEGLLHELNYDNIPNYKNISETYKKQAHDPEDKYSVPYMAGVLGILYNTDKVTEPVDSMGIMFDDKYAGQIFMLNGMRDTIGMTLAYLGYSMNTENQDELNQAKDLLMKQKPNVLAYVTDEVKDKMRVGEGALALVFSGEGMKAVDDTENLAFAIPKEGTNLAIDTTVVLKSSKNIELAEKFIDFLCRPDIALRNAEETGYISPNSAAVAQLPPELKNDPNRNPTKEIIDNSEIFLNLPEEAMERWSQIWTEVLSN